MNNDFPQADFCRSCACVDLDAIRHNFNECKRLLAPQVKVLCTVKADAYGHGAVAVAKALAPLADFFAVSAVSESVELRQAGIETPILILSYTAPSAYATLLDYDIRTTIYSLSDAQALSAAAEQRGKTAVVHIAVDTGMGRIGFPVTEAAARTVQEIAALPHLAVEGIFSHYATADMADKSAAHEQTKRFDQFLAWLDALGVDIPIRHICNSAGTMEFQQHYDMVRLGVALYGLYPSDEVDQTKVDLRPAMQVISHVIHVKTVDAGTPIGYGATYRAPDTRQIATVCIGYADGFNRAYSGKGYVLIHGKKAPVVGRVCMDQVMVDTTGIPNVAVGDAAVILGKSGDEEITADAMGALIDSFGYEVLCNFMPRVQRIYKGM